MRSTNRLAFSATVIPRLLAGLVLALLLTSSTLISAEIHTPCLGPDTRNMLERLTEPRPMNEQEERCVEEQRQRNADKIEHEFRQLEEINKLLQENAKEIERMAQERQRSLANANLSFEFLAYTTGMDGSLFIAACLIDQSGTVYIFDSSKDPYNQSTLTIDEPSLNAAIRLAQSLGDQAWRPYMRGAHLGIRMWTMYRGSTKVMLEIDGDLAGMHTDARVAELLAFMDRWCRTDQITSRAHQLLSPVVTFSR